MRVLVSEKLSPHRFKTPEGYLICTDAILARTGKQTYMRKEVFGDACDRSDEEVEIERSEKEVFSDATLASFENKPLTVEHPEEDVNPENHRDYSVGFTRDIKRGKTDKGEDVMLGTIVVTNSEAIEAIENGDMTELSCGYDCDIIDEENPQQRNIRGNHVALCQRGRAGIARIVDSFNDMAKLSADESSTLKAMIEGGAGESLYRRLSYDKPTTIHLSQEDKELLRWHRDENQYLTSKEKMLLKKLVGDSKTKDASDLSGLYKNDDNDAIKVTRSGFSYEVRFGEDSIFNKGWSYSRSYDSTHLSQYLRQNRFKKVSKFDYLRDSIKDDALQKGKTYVAESGATLKVIDYECAFSDYNGEASVIVTYEYVSASGNKTGRGRANAHDFWKMLTDKSMTGDSVKDDKSFVKGQKFKNENGAVVEIVESNDDNDYVHYTINGRHKNVKSESLKNMLDFNGYSLQDSVKDDFRTEFETFLKSKVDFKGPKISTNYYIYAMKRPYYTTIGEIRTWLQNKNVNFKIDKFPDDVDILISKQNMQDSVKDDKLSDLKVVLRSMSSMQRRDLDIEDVMRTLRNAGFKSIVEKIEGWKENRNVPGEQIKNYTLNIEDLNKHVLVTFYADMGKWTTKEINAYVVDSVKDNLELPEDEDSAIMYRDAYGKEIIVTNWDGRNEFMVEHDGTEQRMNRNDVEYYLDRKGARFSRVLRDSKIAEIENGTKLVQVGKTGAHYAIKNHGLWWIMHRGKTISRHETKEEARRVLEEHALGDSMKDGQLVEVPASTIAAFEGKVRGANINIDGKGKTWSGRIHYQLSYDATKASFDTFVKELERLESWLESIDIPVTFSAGNNGKLYTAGFDIDKKWVRDSVKDSYHQIDMTDQWGGTRSIIVKASSFDEAKKKAEKAHPEWKYKNAWQSSEADFEGAKRRNGLYIDSTQDVDTYKEATNGLKKQAKEFMTDDWSGSHDGYIFSYNSDGDYFVITSPNGKAYKVNGDADPKQVIKTLKYLNKDSMKDSKDDILAKIRSTQIREGETFEMEDSGYHVQIQNTGAQEMSTRSGPFKMSGNASTRLSVKLSSHAWGRIWKDRQIVFNETGPLNVVRDKMIAYLKSVRDSKTKDLALAIPARRVPAHNTHHNSWN